MKNLILLLMTLMLVSCNEKTKNSEPGTESANKTDVQAELELIEKTRVGFQLAIKEKRYGDLKNYSTSDFKGVSPGSEDWLEYKRIREEPMGQFSYDSIKMRPQETIVASDSIAYDYGTSSVYYTKPDGESVELTNTFLVILKKDKNDGNWKIHREVASAIIE